MNPLFYILRKSIKNYFKLMIKKPAKLIGPLFTIAMLGFVIFSSFHANRDKSFDGKYFISIATFAVIYLSLITIYSSIKNSGSPFLMSDVNLAFVSPIKPQNILLYGFIKQIYSTLFFSIFLLFQLPNLSNFFKLVPFGLLGLLFVFMLLGLSLSFLSIFTYSICSKIPRVKLLLPKVVIFIGICIAIPTVYEMFYSGSGAFSTFIAIFSNDAINYVPFVGWIRGMIYQCFYGFNILFLLYAAFTMILLIVLIIILYNLDLDFYEDVLAKSEINETVQKFKNKQIKSTEILLQNNTKKPKVRKITYKYESILSKAIFSKHILEFRKTGFGLLNLYTAFLFVGGICYALLVPIPDKSISYFLYFTIYLNGLSTFGSKFYFEMSKHYIFLIPDYDEKKVFWATLSTIIKYISDSFIVFSTIGILLKANPFEILLCILSYISFGFVFTYGNVLNFRIFGRISSESLKSIIMMFSIFVYIVPGIIGAAIVNSQLSFLGKYSYYFSFLIWNFFASFVILQLGKGVLKTVELD